MIFCWIITEEGLTGTENQCLGVAAALGVSPVVKRIGLRQPWKTFSPWLGLENRYTFTGSPLEPPWPDIVIAAGRKSIAASRYIKKQSGGRTFTVQLQDPRVSPAQFDMVAVPEHDSLRGDNVIVTRATPNRVSPLELSEARQEFAWLLGTRAVPRVAVLIGGSSRAYRMTPEIAAGLTRQLAALAHSGHSLMVTASRRTGRKNLEIITDSLKETNAYIWDGSGANPYYGFLAWADYIIVTADSASMISEAASTGKPVYMVKLAGGSKRFDKLHENLIQQGVIRIFDGTLEPYNYAPLNDAGLVAAEIRRRLGKGFTKTEPGFKTKGGRKKRL